MDAARHRAFQEGGNQVQELTAHQPYPIPAARRMHRRRRPRTDRRPAHLWEVTLLRGGGVDTRLQAAPLRHARPYARLQPVGAKCGQLRSGRRRDPAHSLAQPLLQLTRRQPAEADTGLAPIPGVRRPGPTASRWRSATRLVIRLHSDASCREPDRRRDH
jgi:hypothetical protein